MASTSKRTDFVRTGLDRRTWVWHGNALKMEKKNSDLGVAKTRSFRDKVLDFMLTFLGVFLMNL
jgi:hypothetical protein